MGKIATWQDIRDKGIVFISTGLNMNQCPQKSDITSKIPSPSIEISGSYANNQLVQEADISKPSVEYTIDILFRVEGNTLMYINHMLVNHILYRVYPLELH